VAPQRRTEDNAVSSRRKLNAFDLGYGFLVGGGYGIPLSRGKSILFNVNYALRRVGADTIGTFGMTVGELW
jgi:hypothetical protein